MVPFFSNLEACIYAGVLWGSSCYHRLLTVRNKSPWLLCAIVKVMRHFATLKPFYLSFAPELSFPLQCYWDISSQINDFHRAYPVKADMAAGLRTPPKISFGTFAVSDMWQWIRHPKGRGIGRITMEALRSKAVLLKLLVKMLTFL